MSFDMTLLCLLDALPPGSARGFDPERLGHDGVFAVRPAAAAGVGAVAAVHVYRNDCPHEHRPLGWRKDAFLAPDGRHIMCFAHGARFDIATGLCVEGPCEGRSLEALPCSVRDNGVWLGH